jgi:hypothetical protein
VVTVPRALGPAHRLLQAALAGCQKLANCWGNCAALPCEGPHCHSAGIHGSALKGHLQRSFKDQLFFQMNTSVVHRLAQSQLASLCCHARSKKHFLVIPSLPLKALSSKVASRPQKLSAPQLYSASRKLHLEQAPLKTARSAGQVLQTRALRTEVDTPQTGNM